jgi:hypothetical protein
MRRTFVFVSLALSAIAWLAYALLGHSLAGWIGRKWGSQMLRMGDGKFSDATAFMEHRFFDAALLFTTGIGLLLVAAALGALLGRRLPRLWKWIPHAVTGFAALNIWIKIAMGTCLFWCFFWNGKNKTDNFTQFHIKLELMDENPAPVKVVLGGSSQTRTQIDHRLLNHRLGPDLFSTELHFPGSYGFDFLFLDRKLAGHKADIIVCYLSEVNFFNDGLSVGFPLFFSFGDLPDFLRLGGNLQWDKKAEGYGLLSHVLPAFQLRESLAQRLLGDDVAKVRQRQRDTTLSTNMHERVIEAAATYHGKEQSAFEMAAFELFVARCQAEHRTVVVCCGQVNPLLARELDPALRPQMVSFLKSLAAHHDNVVLLEESALPKQTPEDYEDLTHVNPEAQVRFTEALGDVLEKLIRRKEVAAK